MRTNDISAVVSMASLQLDKRNGFHSAVAQKGSW